VTFSSNWEEIAGRLADQKHFLCLATESKIGNIPAELRESLLDVGHVRAYMLTKGKWMSWTLFAARPQ
jgi:hypothetical protein